MAVVRALHRVPLPEPWEVHYLSTRSGEMALVNACNEDSRTREVWFELDAGGWDAPYDLEEFRQRHPGRFAPGSVFQAGLERDRRYYELDETGRLDMRIEELTSRARGLMAIDHSFKPAALAMIEESQRLKKQKEELEESLVFPSGGNT